jgi:uncharacterized membrane protein
LLAEWETQAFLSKLGSLLLTVVVGILVFLGCGIALRIEELQTLRALIRRRLRRSA